MNERKQSGTTADESPMHLEAYPAPISAVRRIPLLLAALAGFLFAAVLILFFQVEGFLGRLEPQKLPATNGHDRLQVISEQVDTLQGKFSVLMVESVETRLRTLEKNIAAGNANAEDLRAFEQLKHDLAMLRRYADFSGIAALDGAILEHDRYQLQAPAEAVESPKESLAREVRELRNLTYLILLGLASSSLIGASLWLKHRREQTQRLGGVANRAPLLARNAADTGE